MSEHAPSPPTPPPYGAPGVSPQVEASILRSFVGALAPTNRYAEPHARVALQIGFFATVLEVAGGLRLALACDGVGTKLLVAEMLERYDTIGIDLVAMNVNDLLCVGARPVALLDYLAVERPREEFLIPFGRGLAKAAREAAIAVPGGEIAQVSELLRGLRPGAGCEMAAFAVGLLAPGRPLLDGSSVRPGDRVLGLPSSGLHSNGYTLARRVLLHDAGLSLESRPEGWSRTVGEELLEPTRIYVRAVLALLDGGVEVHGLAHVTGEGLLNLVRLRAPATWMLDGLPEPAPVFRTIQRLGGLSHAEMYLQFNMGLGFCVVVAEGEVDRAARLLREAGEAPFLAGRIEEGPQRPVVRVPQLRLRSEGSRLIAED